MEPRRETANGSSELFRLSRVELLLLVIAQARELEIERRECARLRQAHCASNQ